jgi:hypothetical protein
MRSSESTAPRQRLARPCNIPAPDGPNSVVITDGQDIAGSITFHAGQHYLFSPSGEWLGAYPSRAEAMRAAPTRRRS